MRRGIWSQTLEIIKIQIRPDDGNRKQGHLEFIMLENEGLYQVCDKFHSDGSKRAAETQYTGPHKYQPYGRCREKTWDRRKSLGHVTWEPRMFAQCGKYLFRQVKL